MPLDIPDQTIATKIQTPDMFRTIGNILSIRQGQQALQQGAVNLEQSQRTLEPNVSAAQSRAALAGTQANVAAQTAQPTIDQAEAAANLAKFKLTGEYAQKARDISQSLVSDPDVVSGNSEGMIPKIVAAKQTMIESGVPPAVAEVQAAHLIQAAAANPKGVRQMLLNSIQAGVGSGGQAQNVQPSGVAVNNGQQSQVVNTNQFSGIPIGQPIPGTNQQQQLPPTTPVFNSGTNTPGYLGPQPARTVMRGDPADVMRQLQGIKDPTERAEAIAGYQKQLQEVGGFTPSGPALGVAGSVAGTVDSINKDWDSTQSSAKTAGSDIGLLQNIKKFAPGAVTGVETDRRSYLAGLADLLHIDAGTLAKMNTDLLAKNTNMLALAGGDTNLAKTMAEGANPNTHMNKEAILDAANQIIAQRKLALEKQRLLGPIKGLVDQGIATPDVYNTALARINKIDPRVLQLPDMSKEEKQKMMSAMSPSEQDAFIKMTREAHALGLGRE